VTRLGGGCRCGAVRFAVDVDEPVVLSDCNCSIRSKAGFLHLIVGAGDFRLGRGGEALVRYAFNPGTAEHLFCKTCGIKSFYRPRSHPEGCSVNWRCIDPEHGIEPVVKPFDGQD
jgi:hypothetical protein